MMKLERCLQVKKPHSIRRAWKDINLSVAILQVFILLFPRLWKNQQDPEKIPHARGSDILHSVSRRTLILVGLEVKCGIHEQHEDFIHVIFCRQSVHLQIPEQMNKRLACWAFD
jgi:hypothetical protein